VLNSLGGHSLGRYVLLHRLAVGGMGEIFLARERGAAGFQRLVVIKRLLGDVVDDPERIAMFLDEARIAAHLAHPNIVQVYELGEDRGEYYLVMEFVPGQNLGRVLTRFSRTGHPMRATLAAHIVLEAARGLEYAHQARDADGQPLGIVHRDISPANLLIGYRGDVKVADFGIAKASNKESRTRTGVVRGKFSYMAPEQVSGGAVDARCDVWALGVVLWEASIGRSLFQASNDPQIIKQVLEMPVPRPTSMDPYYPPALEAVVMQALERDLNKRTPSAEALATALRRALRQGSGLSDATEVATMMASTFATEIQELDALVAEATAMPLPTPAEGQVAALLATPTHLGKGRARAAASSSPSTQVRGRTPRRWLPAVLATLVGVAAVIGGTRFLTQTRRPRSAAAPGGLDAATPADLPRVVAAAATSDAAAEPVQLVLGGAVLDETAGLASERKKRHDSRVAQERPLDAGASPLAATSVQVIDAGAAAASADAMSELRISAPGWISLDGKRMQRDQLRTRVSAGSHRLGVTLDDGRELTIHIEAHPGAVMRCQVRGDQLTCSR
jgi:serine/threonine-protein kinase